MTETTLEQEAEQALNKAAAIRLVRDRLLSQGEKPETALIARILASPFNVPPL